MTFRSKRTARLTCPSCCHLLSFTSEGRRPTQDELTISWWIEIATAGEKPGLSLFEDIDSENPRSLFERVKLLFASKPRFQALAEAGADGTDREQGGVEGYDADEAATWRREREQDEYEDHSESGWAARRAAGEVGDDDDTLETAIILTVVVIIMGLVYVRGRWVRQQEEQIGQPWGRP